MHKSSATLIKPQSFTQLITNSTTRYSSRNIFILPSNNDYRTISYTQFAEDIFNLSATITKNYNQHDKIALIGENSYHWVVSYFATVISGKVIVPLDKELTYNELENLLKQSDTSLIFCSNDYIEVMEQINTPIDVINTTDGETFNKLLSLGSSLRENNLTFGQNEKTNSELCTIVFTSGTTGFSKGVMLSADNILSNVHSSNKFIDISGTGLCILPMNHGYCFTLDILLAIHIGTTVVINNSIKRIAQNIKAFKPTYFLMVPLVAENLMLNLWNTIEAQGKTKSVQMALKVSRFLKLIGIDVRRKLFKKIIDGLGGELKSIFVGGSPVNPIISKQFYDFGIIINIGYGITECSPLIAGNILDNPTTFDTCGVAIPDVQIRINNPNSEGDGEIEVSGSSVMMGYYNNPQATAEVLCDGWFKTGDIGRIDKRGLLIITGRIKNIIVLNNSKNIYPEEIEFQLENEIPLISEIVVSANKISNNSNNTEEETTLKATIYISPEVLEQEPKAQDIIRAKIEDFNDRVSYFKRIVTVVFKDEEFAKTSTKKIKRY